jgi:hypothetical protein
MTPKPLAKMIVDYFNPTGKMLEPCRGNGSFMEYMPNADWCEITDGRDFFEYNNKVDWIITNPPWSIFRPFLIHSLKVSDNIVFLIPIVHYFGKARLREIKNAGFGFKEMIFIDTPKSFPQMGFQLGVVHIQKDYKGKCKMTWKCPPQR